MVITDSSSCNLFEKNSRTVSRAIYDLIAFNFFASLVPFCFVAVFNVTLVQSSLFMEWLQVDEAVLKKHSKINNDWLDKELNFNRERLREAEELKLQQMRIEQEVIILHVFFGLNIRSNVILITNRKT